MYAFLPSGVKENGTSWLFFKTVPPSLNDVGYRSSNNPDERL
jgi:hypothetical protein